MLKCTLVLTQGDMNMALSDKAKDESGESFGPSTL